MSRYILSALVLVFVGCGYQPDPPVTGTGGTTVNGKSVVCGRWGDKTIFVIWPDIEGVNGSGSGSAPGKATYEGSIKPAEGRGVDWRCETGDGQTGVVTINGTKYELADGGLFLVTTRGKEAGVAQLKHALPAAKSWTTGLEKLAKEDPDVAAFLAKKPE